MSRSLDFFQLGGTLSEDAPSYIERPADRDLLAALEQHQFCLVLAPRQMGKSSLMVHAIVHLKKKGVASAAVDLQLLGSEKDIDCWFRDIIYQIKRTAKLRANTKEWWEANRHLGSTQRFMAFLEEVALRELSGNLVIFFDEIDSVLNLPFSDDFFTTIRSIHNSRAVNPVMQRLTVVLLGVATASSFIKDRSRTPFNIGKSITLTDFSRDKTKPFQEVLGPGSEQLVDRIFYWTNGQPLLVQKLAATVYSWPPENCTPGRIDSEVEQSYLQLKIEQDTHFKFIQDYLLDTSSDVRKTLSTYRDVLKGKCVENNEQPSIQDRLKLAGVVRVEDGKLLPRNRIYKRIFNLQWLQEHLPADIQKRIAYAASLAFVITFVGLLWLFFVVRPFSAGRPSLDRPLRVAIVTWPGFAGGIVANNGFKPNRDCIFYKNHNLEVEFLLMEDVDVRASSFAKGGVDGIDIVWSSVDFLANELPGFMRDNVGARAVMQVDWSRGGDAIVVDKSINRIEDLKGKKVSLAMFTPSHWLLEYSLENSSLDESDQARIINDLVGKSSSPDARADFVAGKVDAAVIWEPDVTEALQKRPGSKVLVSSKTASNLIAYIFVAREDFIRQYPDEIRSFIQGWFEGTEEAHRRPDLAVKLLMENEPLYKALGEKATRDGLSTVKWADLADNTQMFGLDGSHPLFDDIFKQASQAWAKRGYISIQVAPSSAKDDTFLSQIYQAAVVKPQRPYDNGFKASPDLATKSAIVTKQIGTYFPQGSAVLDKNSKQILDQVAVLVQAYSNAYIRIEGNTDNAGLASQNKELSEKRAQAVVDYLVSTYKFNPSRFIAIGNGQDKPIASNSTEDGRARNRRIDVAIVPK